LCLFDSKPFITIGNFHVPYKNFQSVFKPRQYMGSDVMSLYTEKFNIENQKQSSENKMMKKKFAFSMHFTVSVKCVFVGSVCIHAVIFFSFPCTEYVAFCMRLRT
jgi:hypothetical protein